MYILLFYYAKAGDINVSSVADCLVIAALDMTSPFPYKLLKGRVMFL
jgi:hypothetical protein